MLRFAYIWIALIILFGAVIVEGKAPELLDPLRNRLFDFYQTQSPRAYRPAPVRVVDIDEASLQRFGQWPWPRTRLAELLDRLRELGVASVAFDILMPEPDRTSPIHLAKNYGDKPKLQKMLGELKDHDAIFAESIGRGRTVIGFSLVSEENDHVPSRKKEIAKVDQGGSEPKPSQYLSPQYRGAVTSLKMFEDAAEGYGSVNFSYGEGVVRNVPLLVSLNGEIYPSLAVEALRVALPRLRRASSDSSAGDAGLTVLSSSWGAGGNLGKRVGIFNVRIGDIAIPTDEKGQVWLHFSEDTDARFVSALSVFEDPPPQGLENAIVFIGSSAESLKDLRLSPLGYSIPGVQVQAELLEQLLQGTYLTRPDWATAAEIIFLIVVSVILVFLVSRLGALWSALVGLAATIAACVASWIAFSDFQFLFDPMFPSLTLLVLYLACSVPRHMQSERDRRWIRDAFSRYISPKLVEDLIANPGKLVLGGFRQPCSFVLTDLEGFTKLVEGSKQPEEDIVPLLNEYLDQMIQVAFDHYGTIDRIIGDAVAVMFSAPVQQEDHAERAVACAMAMDALAQKFAKAKRAEGIELGKTRIGVNTGEVVIGNFGGKNFFDYRALGDTVNTAARLETVNGILGTRVCVSQNTVDAINERAENGSQENNGSRPKKFLGRDVAELRLKGKVNWLKAYEPLTQDESESERTKAYNEAYQLLVAKAPDALDAFAAGIAQFPEDPLFKFHFERLRRGEEGIRVSLTAKG